MLTLKIKVILPTKWIHLGTAKNCSLGQIIAKAIGKPKKQRRGLFYREKGGNWEGLF